MNEDIDRFFRLKSSIDRTLELVDAEPGSVEGVLDAYVSFRTEAQMVARDNDLEDEFDRLFPSIGDATPPAVTNLHARKAAAMKYRALLARLSGWLEGSTQAVRLREESRAYAIERARLEAGRVDSK